jgi:uncharacterized protein YigE (DUF2233 family)
MKNILLLFICVFVSFGSQAADSRFTVISVDTHTEKLEIFFRNDKGQLFNRFNHLVSWLEMTHNKQLKFAMNAGMFHKDFSPVGLLVLENKQQALLNLTEGTGNFFLKPNGVFLVLNSSEPRIIESSEYPAIANNVRLATQSGPLLLKHGSIHPAFNVNSTSRLIRNGVGVLGHTVTFVISEQPVTFYELAAFFRDDLHCTDALYLDGVVSSLYSTELQRNDLKTDLGAIIGVVQ